MDEDDETMVLLEDQEILPLQWCVVLSCLLFDTEAVSKDFEYSDCKRRSWVRSHSGAAVLHRTRIQAAWRISRCLLITIGDASLLAMDDMKESIAFYSSIRVRREGISG
jgi:hypothetical protein